MQCMPRPTATHRFADGCRNADGDDTAPLREHCRHGAGAAQTQRRWRGRGWQSNIYCRQHPSGGHAVGLRHQRHKDILSGARLPRYRGGRGTHRQQHRPQDGSAHHQPLWQEQKTYAGADGGCGRSHLRPAGRGLPLLYLSLHVALRDGGVRRKQYSTCGPRPAQPQLPYARRPGAGHGDLSLLRGYAPRAGGLRHDYWRVRPDDQWRALAERRRPMQPHHHSHAGLRPPRLLPTACAAVAQPAHGPRRRPLSQPLPLRGHPLRRRSRHRLPLRVGHLRH